MKTVICKKYGPPEVLELAELPIPSYKAKECLIRVKATAVNSGDVRVRGLVVSGLQRILMLLVLGFRKPRKPVLGTVFSGIVDEIGEQVTKFKKGDEVFGMTGFQFGSYAEYISIREDSAISLKPKNASFEQAVALVFGGSTADWFLDKYGCKAGGKKILIYGGTGSVGVAAIQLALHYNNEVTVVCGESGIDLVHSLGIEKDKILTYHSKTLKEDIQKRGVNYDLIFDAVGKTNKEFCLPYLAQNGKFASVEGWEVVSETKEQLELMKELHESGKMKAVIDRTYPLEEIVEAHRYVDSGRKKGNVVVTIES
jgi:NADPH:quinone reductase-like Zn-dependent oxidoreductase